MVINVDRVIPERIEFDDRAISARPPLSTTIHENETTPVLRKDETGKTSSEDARNTYIHDSNITPTTGRELGGKANWHPITSTRSPKLSPAMGQRSLEESRQSVGSGFDKARGSLRQQDIGRPNRSGEGSFPSTGEPTPAEHSFAERPQCPITEQRER